jgi:hypothetical protein
MRTKGKTKPRGKRQRIHDIELRPAFDRLISNGAFRWRLGDADGNPIGDPSMWVRNTVVTVGREWVLKHIMSATSANSAVSTQFIQALAVGTTGTAPTTSDTLLGGEIQRNTNTTETFTAGSSVPNCVWAVSFGVNQANDTTNGIREFGLFNTSTSGAQTMLAHATTGSFTKTSTNTLTVSYTISN